MTSPTTIIAIVGTLVTAARQAVAFAEQLGVGEDAIAALKRIEAKANEEAARLLGPEVRILDVAVQLTKARTDAAIDSMPEDPVCPRCRNVLTRSINKFVGSGESVEVLSKCDACGWTS